MKSLRRIWLISMSGVMLVSCVAAADKAPSLNVAPYEQEVERLLESLQSMTGVPGYSVAIVQDGELIASVAVGSVDVANNKPATQDHLFRLASASKIIGSTMLADLVHEGRLDPDAPIGSFYPSLDERYHQTTVRQLMAHTSGIPHYQAGDDDIYNKHYDEAIEAVKTLKGRDLLATPGSNYHYSSHGHTLAGAVYETISGEPLSSSLPKYIQDMTGQSTPLIENITDLHPMSSMLYARADGRYVQQDFGEKSYSVFGAGMSATASDLAHFGDRVLQKSRQSNSYHQLLFTPVQTTTGGLTGNGAYEVGFGWRIGQDDYGRKIYHHAGATPGARSVIVLYPDENLSVVFLSNASWVSSIERTASIIANLFLNQANASSLNATRYEGEYNSFPLLGDMNCNERICSLEDGESEFASWLNRFNATGGDVSAWPAFAFKAASHRELILVTKVGFVSLISQGETDEYRGVVGRRDMRIRLSPAHSTFKASPS